MDSLHRADRLPSLKREMVSQESGIEMMETETGATNVYEYDFEQGIDEHPGVLEKMEDLLHMFERLTTGDQTDLVKRLISRMNFHQHEHIFSHLLPMLQRDFVSNLAGTFVYFIRP